MRTASSDWKTLLVTWPLFAVIVLLTLFGAIGMEMLSAARDYVEAQGLWSMAQKEAVAHLNRYSQTRADADYRGYEALIAVNLGDRNARLALDRDDPDLQAASSGFLEGRNHPDDIPGMIRLFRYFRHNPLMSGATEIWTKGDALIARLHAAAQALRAEIRTGARPERLGATLQEIRDINERLAPLEDEFSQALGEASRKIKVWLMGIGGVGAALLVAFGSLLLRRDLVRQKHIQTQLRLVTENVPALIAVFDSGWRCSMCNRHYSEMFRKDPADIVGRRLRDIVGNDQFREIQPHFAAAFSGRVVHYERRVQLPTGNHCDLDVTLVPQHGAGKIAQVYALSHDITERKAAEEKLAQAHQRLDLALRASRVSIWEWDGRRGSVYLDEAWAEILGADPRASHVTIEELAALVHPDDVARAYKAQSDCMRGLVAEYALEHRVRAAAGTWKWILSHGKVVERHAQGHALRVTGTNMDITERKVAEEALRLLKQRFETIVQSSPQPITITGIDDGRMHEVNEAWMKLLGYRREEVIGRTSIELRTWADPAERVVMKNMLLAQGSVPGMECRFRAKSGEILDVLFSGGIIELAGEKLLLAQVMDITERKRTERLLRESEKRFGDVVEAAGEYVWEVDKAWRYTYLSPRVKDVLGYAPQELLGKQPLDLMGPEEAARVAMWFRDRAGAGTAFRDLDHTSLDASGRQVWQRVSGVPIADASGNFAGYRGTGLDITERKIAEQQFEQLATHDPLTRLPNRLLLADRLSHGMPAAQRKGDLMALLFIDLDRFKTINDSLGHPVGDGLLKQVSERLAGATREGDTLARLGGDEFVVVLESLRRAEDAGPVAKKIIDMLSRPYRVDGHTLNTSCSIGISLYPTDATDGPTLMRNADMAMYSAKERGRQNYQFFSHEMNQRAMERLALEGTLRQAIERGEFELYYHPKFSLKTNAIVGMEALMRWHHPELGLVAPARFIPVCEETKLIVPLGEWAVRAACAQAKAWAGRGYAPLPVAVNFSVVQFNKDLVKTVHDALNESGLEARYFEAEITESLLMRNVDENIEILRKLSRLGVRIAIDDFGTGFSSLSYLRRFKLDTLKIDKSFVQGMVTSNDDLAIVKAVIALAHTLKMNVVAEGVETRKQKDTLRALNCNEWQGYYACEPLPEEEFEKRFLLKKSPPRATARRVA